jgi:hypothetical protein
MAAVGKKAVCDRCVQIERDLKSYRRMHDMADDKLALSLLAEVIEDLRSEKAALHPGNLHPGNEKE